MNKLLILLIVILLMASCTKKEDVTPEAPPSLIGTWTIKAAKNLSATMLTAKANATIVFTDTKYTVNQAQPFANYKNTANLTEYIRFKSNSTYKLLPIEETQPLVESDLKLFFGENITNASKNISAVIALYKKEGVRYVAMLEGATVVATNTAGGTETTDIPAFGIVNFTANGVTLEEISFGDVFQINSAAYVPQLPAANTRAQILLEK
ncbi:hypothetical protein [Arundinibacter roseus]|uniref:Lipocalin-like domain-containing protein n=1 Tax=Arundinibacter roseus TaxID=2070510 RepID=A0A4R4JY86_9BACT|nr:hypothetical protein [Arundinibacter roseus]TDB59126.1 hypothetical protein EZE20_22615 [Arundinibacter roseus]